MKNHERQILSAIEARHEEPTGPRDLEEIVTSTEFEEHIKKMGRIARVDRQEAAFAVYKTIDGYSVSKLLKPNVTASCGLAELDDDPFIARLNSSRRIETAPLTRRELNVYTVTTEERNSGKFDHLLLDGETDEDFLFEERLESRARKITSQILLREPWLDRKYIREVITKRLEKEPREDPQSQSVAPRDDIAMLVHCHPGDASNQPSEADMDGYYTLREENPDLIEGIVSYDPKRNARLRLIRTYGDFHFGDYEIHARGTMSRVPSVYQRAEILFNKEGRLEPFEASRLRVFS